MGRNVIQFKDKDNNVYDVKDVVARTTKADVIINNTESAPITNVKDAIGDMPVKTLEVQIDPVQDLHGYDNPWPAGGGKNLLNPTGTSGTDASVTYTKGTDGKWTSSGTASGTSTILVGEFDVKAGVGYTLNGCPSGGGSAAYRIDVRTAPSSIYNDWIDTGSGMTFTPAEDAHLYVYIRAASGTNMSGKTFSPMIRLSSVSDDTFAPYKNECSISGWDSANVSRTGKNLLTDKFYTGFGYNDDVGTVKTLVEDSTVTRSGNNFTKTVSSWGGTGKITAELKPGTYKCNIAVSSSGATKTSLYVFDKDYKIVRRIGNMQADTIWSDTITISGNEAYIAVNVSNSSSGTVTFSSPQVEIGSTATEYTNYSGSTTEYAFPTEAGEVPGGKLTIWQDGTGTLVVENADVDLGTLNYTKANQFFYADAPSDSAPVIGNGQPFICEIYKRYVGALSSMPDFTAGLNNVAFSGIKVFYCKDSRFDNASDFKTAMSGVKLVYPLATPVVYNLTAQDVIALLKGNNNLWADCGNISIEYPADTKLYIDGKIAELQALILES